MLIKLMDNLWVNENLIKCVEKLDNERYWVHLYPNDAYQGAIAMGPNLPCFYSFIEWLRLNDTENLKYDSYK